MRPTCLWVLVVALLPTTLSASVLPDAGEAGQGPAPIPRRGDGSVAYVVVTDRQLQGAFMPLVQARTRGGLPAAVVTLESIQQGYPAGVDLAEKIRLFLKDAHANWGTRWVLLGGDASVVPMRRVRLLPGFPPPEGIDLPTDQYYACLDGSWNADGDSLWGENPLSPVEPGDDVDFFPELFVGRAPVRTHAEVADFVRRTMAYEDRLAAAGSRTALLAADVINGLVDGAFATENLRPALEADPDRQIVRLYENAAAWPGALPESRPALLDALARGRDLAVLVGAGGHGVLVAGQDFCCADYVTADDLLGLTNEPLYPIVYVESAYTTDPDPPLSIGAALMHARRGGAAAVLGATGLQAIGIGAFFAGEFFDAALGPAAPRIGEALARAVAAVHAQFQDDVWRLTTQGMVLLGDPALRLDPGDAAQVLRIHGRPALPVRADAAQASLGLEATSAPDVGASLAIAVREAGARTTKLRNTTALPAASGSAPEREVVSAPARLEATDAVHAPATLRFEFSAAASGARYELAVFDVMGRRVRSLSEGVATPSRSEAVWDLRSDAGAPVPSGVYYARLQLASDVLARRVLVLR